MRSISAGRSIRQHAERVFLILPALVLHLILPRKLGLHPLSFVFKFKVRNSLSRIPACDQTTHARALAQSHDAAANSFPESRHPLANAFIQAHQETAAYCRQLFDIPPA